MPRRLLATIDYDTAKAKLDSHLGLLQQMLAQSRDSRPRLGNGWPAPANAQARQRPDADEALVKGAISQVEYLRDYWLKEELWESWSQKGRDDAFAYIGESLLPSKGVVTTTNHLESFNNALKNHYIAREQSNGHRLRIDFLYRLLVKKILPGVFLRRQALETSRSDRRDAQRRAIERDGRGAVREADASTQGLETSQTARIVFSDARAAYWEEDLERDQAALLMWNHVVRGALPQVDCTVVTVAAGTTTARRAVKASVPSAKRPGVTYEVIASCAGEASCTCEDFKSRFGASCKHIRLVVRYVMPMRNRSLPEQEQVVCPLPKCPEAAVDLMLALGEVRRVDVQEVQELARAIDEEMASQTNQDSAQSSNPDEETSVDEGER